MTITHATRPWAARTAALGSHERLLARGARALREDDPRLARMLDQETLRQQDELAMVAHASVAHPSVLAAAGSALGNVTAEGYPGARYHPGTACFDEVERLAVRRAMDAFGAAAANVQPHSCTSANLAVLFALARPGETILGLDLDAGGHLTHGAGASVTGRFFRAVSYGLDAQGRVDHDQVEALAIDHCPRVIIAGASAYSRVWDYQRFRAIADRVGAYLLADISHVAGLVVAGEHPNPVNVAHVTTTSTYKQLAGPRGGLILLGAGARDLAGLMQRAVFPRSQGTPNPAAIAAKARALDLATRPEFAAWAQAIVLTARQLARRLTELGYPLVSGGTDNHMALVDLRHTRLTGAIAEASLQECGILANRNRVPGDLRPPLIASGLRVGTNILAQRGMDAAHMNACADLAHRVLSAVEPLGEREYWLPPGVRAAVHEEVARWRQRFPLAGYDWGRDEGRDTDLPSRPAAARRTCAVRS